MSPAHTLNVFLCHSSQDKPAVRKLYQRLLKYGNLEPWLDEKKILPGQDWDLEIKRAMRSSDVIIICLSNHSVSKEGYVQKELKLALDIALEKPEGVIFLIPLLLDDCRVPDSLKNRQWVKYYEDLETNHAHLVRALSRRASNLGVSLHEYSSPYSAMQEPKDLYRLIKIPEDERITYQFWISKYPVTNAQYERFVTAPDFLDDSYWEDFPMYDYLCDHMSLWTKSEYSHTSLEGAVTEIHDGLKEKPQYWDRADLGRERKYAPVVAVNWYGANAYCKWLKKHWFELSEAQSLSKTPSLIRLPHEKEWVKAAGGDKPKNRFPWDKKGRSTKSLNEIRRYANLGRGGYWSTTPVDSFPNGASPFGVMDMSGNMREWQSNLFTIRLSTSLLTKRIILKFAVRGGWYKGSIKLACLSGREDVHPDSRYFPVGFRIVAFSTSIA